MDVALRILSYLAVTMVAIIVSLAIIASVQQQSVLPIAGMTAVLVGLFAVATLIRLAFKNPGPVWLVVQVVSAICGIASFALQVWPK